MKNSLNLEIYDSHSLAKRRQKKTILLLLLIILLGIGGYLVWPTLMKSVTRLESGQDQEQIIKSIPLPNIKQL